MGGSLERYIQTAKRLWLLVALTFALVAVPGLFAAYTEYMTTFQSDATVWVERATQQYGATGAVDDPNLFGRTSPGVEQTEIFLQLVQTNSFIIEVIGQTSLQPAYEAAEDKDKFLNEVRKRFRGQALGTNLVRLSYQAREPGIAAEMVTAALVARESRVKNARLAATATSTAFYQKEFEIAQRQALVAQTALEQFNRAARPGPLPATDEYQQNQLRLAVDVAQGRLNDVRTRLERGTVSTALLDMAESMQFQIIDRPQADPFPTGGTRGASLIAAVALAGAVALAICVVIVATLLDNRIRDLVGLSRFRDVEVFGVVEKSSGTARDATVQTLFDASEEPSAIRRRTA